MRLAAAALAVATVTALADASEGAAKPPHVWLKGARCVHRYEGSWRDPDPPYYGGMQMDWRFMHRYGGWILKHHGTAEHWPIRTQLLVAYRGWLIQGWYAWPVTARLCGLI